MRRDRRAFIGGSATLLSAAMGLTDAKAALGATPLSEAQPQKAPDVKPFFEDRGAPSANPAVQTQAIAAYTANLSFAELDSATVEKAKHRILDLVGCLIGGLPGSGNAALLDVVHEGGGTPEASVAGMPWKTSAAQAAMVNAVIARSYDFEVMTVGIGGQYIGSHDSPTTCMTALALSERGKLSGKEFITALVVGDDIAARLLGASGLDFRLGWDGAAIYPPIPAAAIASRLIGLSAQQTQDAFGLTVDTIAGSNQNTWDSATDWKLQQGLAARNGIFAAELAKRGWVGIGDALRAPYGLFSQYTAGCARPDLLTADLGKTFHAEEYFKPYPACGASHTSLECALDIRAKNNLSAHDIQRGVVYVSAPSFTSTLTKPFEPGRYAHCGANFSIQFQVANALLHGSVEQGHYADAALRSPELTAMVKKVSLQPLKEGHSGVEIEITTQNGSVLTEHHSGTPSRYPGLNPLSYDEIVAKFRRQVAFSDFVSDKTALEIIRRVANLEHERNMGDFMELLTKSRFKA
jgi:2-methylcitrate dehydratase